LKQKASRSFKSGKKALLKIAVLAVVAFFIAGCTDSAGEKDSPGKAATSDKVAAATDTAAASGKQTDAQRTPAGKQSDAVKKDTSSADDGEIFLQDLPPVPSKPGMAENTRFSMVYTTDVFGEIEHCGCPGHPRGGLARRVEYVQKLEEKGPVLQVDAGNLFFPYRGRAPRINETQKERAQVLAKGMSRLGVHAVNVGYQDIQASVDDLKELTAPENMDPVPLVCANLYTAEGERVFAPYQVVGIEGVQVAILGMMGPGDLYGKKNLEIKDPVKAASALVPYLKDKCDLLVLLYAGDFKDLNQLVKNVKGIDIAVVSSRSSRITHRPFIAGETLVLQSGRKGMYLGQMDLTVNKEVRQKMSEKDRAALQEKLDRLRAQQKLLTGPAVRDPDLRKEHNRVTRQIDTISRKLATSISKLDYKNHIVSLDTDLPEDEKTRQWMDQVLNKQK